MSLIEGTVTSRPICAVVYGRGADLTVASIAVTDDPFDRLTPDLDDSATGVRVWLTSPAGALVRVRKGTFLDLDVAMRITSTGELRSKFPSGTRLRFVLDFREAVGYNTSARQLLASWGIEERERIAKLTFVTPPSAVFRMGLATLMLGLHTTGIDCELVETLTGHLTRRELVPLRAGPV